MVIEFRDRNPMIAPATQDVKRWRWLFVDLIPTNDTASSLVSLKTEQHR